MPLNFWERQARNAGRSVGSAWDEVSGANATRDAAKQQMQGLQQGQGAITDAYQQGQGLLAPYQQGAKENFQNLQNGINSGAYTPKYQQYGGAQSSGLAQPQFQGLGNRDTSYEGFGYSAPDQFNPGQYKAPQPFQRQAATAENIQAFANPFLDQIIAKGNSAIENSAAGRGLLGSSATLNKVGDWSATAAQNGFNDAYGKFQDAQNQGMMDYQDQRNFGRNAFEGDRAFGQNAFQDARNFGRGNFEFDQNFGQENFNNSLNFDANQLQSQNSFNQQNANRTQSAFEGDRAFGYGMNQDQNSWNSQNAQDRYNMQNGLVGMGFNAAGAGASLATGYGQDMANLYTGMGNANAAATMTKSGQRRGLFGDMVDMGFRGAAAAGGAG